MVVGSEEESGVRLVAGSVTGLEVWSEVGSEVGSEAAWGVG